MRRQQLGHAPVAVLDTTSGGSDTGNPPTLRSPLIGDFNDLSPRFNHGVTTTIGYHFGTSAIELTGFYLAEANAFKQYENPGRLNSVFNVNGSFTTFPLGFEGDAGMWLQDDVIRIRLQTSLASGEANYRCWLGSGSNFSYLVGVRYLQIYERFSFFAGDDDLTVRDIDNNTDPHRQATYTTTTNNHIAAGQLGFEWNQAINCTAAFSMRVKGAWGPNFVDYDTILKRGDSLTAFEGHSHHTIFSHVYDAGFFIDWNLCDRAKLRTGYNLMWALNVAEAVDQLDYNLANELGRQQNRGSMFYHGPSVELQLLF